ncbi:nuclear transport factor 2 family protein [Amycolatopsis sp. 195334CR]|uniref:nuclear transport factor 2 family protein n=1 Tax=Amycolatopsis sp. 195334CR TaxID=2814588 RepID=UPI001A8F3E36|nr:nuclear transport factor 2 family protein [Amycolatopsis sp. 195334CR]MBN6038088.1 nuclear transport factor 2 family protein [Amycolatopsis sp. 195334CR]
MDIADLIALEEIKRLKYRYLRCVDTKDWDDLADALTEDAVADYGTPSYGKPLALAGREAILEFLRTTLVPEIITTHFATQPEIDLDGDRATGTWAFQDLVIATEHRVVIAGAAFYEDTYRRGADGRWRIARTGYQRTYETSHSLDDLPSLRFTANRWAPAPATAD